MEVIALAHVDGTLHRDLDEGNTYVINELVDVAEISVAKDVQPGAEATSTYIVHKGRAYLTPPEPPGPSPLTSKYARRVVPRPAPGVHRDRQPVPVRRPRTSTALEHPPRRPAPRRATRRRRGCAGSRAVRTHGARPTRSTASRRAPTPRASPRRSRRTSTPSPRASPRPSSHPDRARLSRRGPPARPRGPPRRRRRRWPNPPRPHPSTRSPPRPARAHGTPCTTVPPARRQSDRAAQQAGTPQAQTPRTTTTPPAAPPTAGPWPLDATDEAASPAASRQAHGLPVRRSHWPSWSPSRPWSSTTVPGVTWATIATGPSRSPTTPSITHAHRRRPSGRPGARRRLGTSRPSDRHHVRHRHPRHRRHPPPGTAMSLLILHLEPSLPRPTPPAPTRRSRGRVTVPVDNADGTRDMQAGPYVVVNASGRRPPPWSRG